jgi:hypothetical protein
MVLFAGSADIINKRKEELSMLSSFFLSLVSLYILKIQKCSYLELELSYPSKLYLIISDD